MEESALSAIDSIRDQRLIIFVDDIYNSRMNTEIGRQLEGWSFPYMICLKDCKWRPNTQFLDYVIKHCMGFNITKVTGFDESKKDEIIFGTKEGRRIYHNLIGYGNCSRRLYDGYLMWPC